MKLLLAFIAFSIPFFASAEVQKDSRDIQHENGYYNGKRLDPSTSSETIATTPKIEKNFTGQVIVFSIPEGRKQAEFFLENGAREGEYRTYDSSGRVQEVAMYREGKRNGMKRNYDTKTGTLTQESSYQDDVLAGIQRDFIEGRLSRTYFIDKTGNIDTEISFNQNAQPTSLKCGKYSVHSEDDSWCGRSGPGKVQIFDDEGKLQRVAEYLNSEYHGKVLDFRYDGSVETTVYAKGEELSTTRTQDGVTLMESSLSSKGAGTKIERVFFEGSKQLKAERLWENNILVSEKEYWENGQLHVDWKQDANRLIQVKDYWDNGKLAHEGSYKSAFNFYWSYLDPHGTLNYYDKDGLLQSMGQYENGQRQGLAKFYKKGKLIRTEQYAADSIQTSEDFDSSEKSIRKTEYHTDGSRKAEFLGN